MSEVNSFLVLKPPKGMVVNPSLRKSIKSTQNAKQDTSQSPAGRKIVGTPHDYYKEQTS